MSNGKNYEQPYPNERAGFRYRRILGESLTRSIGRFIETNPNAPIAGIFVHMNTRDGTTLATLSLTNALRALQFNLHTFDAISLAEASEAIVFVKAVM